MKIITQKTRMPVKVIELNLPEYTLGSKPDYTRLGKEVDDLIIKNFPEGRYIVRAIGKDDHPSLSLKELVEVIIETGTDRYLPDKKGVAHDFFSDYDYEIHASLIEIKDGKIIQFEDYDYESFFAEIIYNFYENAPKDRGHAVRIDLLLFYDPKMVLKAKKVYSNNEPAKDLDLFLYKFKNPDNKKDALLGIVKILR